LKNAIPISLEAMSVGVIGMVNETERKIDLEIERNRIRISIFHGEDEQIIKLTPEEAEELAKVLEKVLEDYSKRKQIRID
jgi:hypothetical protein